MANKVKRNFCINHFSIMLQRLVKANKISSQSAERAKTQYSSFFDVVDSNVTALKDFNKENDHLDSCLPTLLVEIKAVPICRKSVRLCPLCLMDSPL